MWRYTRRAIAGCWTLFSYLHAGSRCSIYLLSKLYFARYRTRSSTQYYRCSKTRVAPSFRYQHLHPTRRVVLATKYLQYHWHYLRIQAHHLDMPNCSSDSAHTQHFNASVWWFWRQCSWSVSKEAIPIRFHQCYEAQINFQSSIESVFCFFFLLAFHLWNLFPQISGCFPN